MKPKFYTKDYWKGQLVRPVKVTECIGYDHQPDCPWWHGQVCNCAPVRVVWSGKRIYRETADGKG